VTNVGSYKDGGGSLRGMLGSGMSGLNCESSPVLGRVCLVCGVSWRGPSGGGGSVWTGPRSVLGHRTVRNWEFRQWFCEKPSGLVDSDLLALQPRALSCQD
jgi:hypothetical protein